jgi:hypothetical protein
MAGEFSPHTGRDTNTGAYQMPAPSRAQAAANPAEEIAACAFIRARMADDVDKHADDRAASRAT